LVRADGFGEPGHPILRIETGMHGAAINRVVRIGPDILTVSDDKTLRRWSLPSGQANGLWRVPIGPGDQGALYTVAVNDTLAVVGGRTGDGSYGLYFFDLAGNRLLGTVAGFAEPISALAFAEGGTLLAVGLQRRGGLAVVDVQSHKIAAVDHDYGGTINWLAFSSAGKLASSSADGKIRLYGGSYAHPAQIQSMGEGEIPWGLAFSPDGSLLAVGSAESASVGLYLSERLQRASVMIGTSTASGALSVVAWNGDGSILAAAGQYKGGALRNQVRFWPMRGGKIDTTDVVASPDTITDLAFLADGTLAYGTAEGAFGVLGVDGKSRLSRQADQCDFRDIWQGAFAVSADASVVDFGCRHGALDHYRVDLTDLSVRADPAPRADLVQVAAVPGVRPENWRNGTALQVAGHTVTLDRYEHIRSLAGVAGQGAVLAGTDYYLRLEDASGERWHVVLPAPAWSVAVSPNGETAVAALGDGTIRWYKLSVGAEVASLFVDARDRRWVIWVPEGFFEHGQGAASLVGFQLNNGAGKAPDFAMGAGFEAAYHRPDLVRAKIQGGADGAHLVADAWDRLGDGRTLLDAASR
jgi:WD40 repeat protein